MRLGFAVAIHVDPDVLLVDEVLAVGDEGFTHKCLDKFGEFRRRGKTILLVTHSLGLVERFCDEALWLEGGKVRATGDPRRVVGAYVTAVEDGEEAHAGARGRARARRSRGGRRRWRRRQRPDGSGRGGGHRRHRRADADRHVPGLGRALGIARGRDRRRHADRRRGARPCVPRQRDADRAARRDGGVAGHRLRVRVRPVQRRRRLRLRHQHRSRGSRSGGDQRRAARSTSSSTRSA